MYINGWHESVKIFCIYIKIFWIILYYLNEQRRNILEQLIIYIASLSNCGHALAHLVEALRYKSEGRVFGSRWADWDCSFRPQYGPGVDSAANKFKYHESSLGG